MSITAAIICAVVYAVINWLDPYTLSWQCLNRPIVVAPLVIQYILYLAVLIVLAIPLGAYIKKVMNGEKTFLSKILTPAKTQYTRL